ncbi:serine hydrolase domain-containing protein [Flavobacterium sp.]|uniref:serine hydrolase domain-containing protein n=1 Tax=Flavobacterium sp. TaxID=239 RepID=UPI0040332CF9
MKKYTCLPALALVLLITSSCKVGRFAYYNFANITDHKIFPARTAEADPVHFHFAEAPIPKAPKKLTVGNREMTFENFLEQNRTVAFIIIRNDSIQYENYFKGYKQESVVASFSMAKSVTSILIGCAIDDGLIKSVDEPMVNYIPELDHDGMEKVTIAHLLNMKSGIKFNESYVNPFGDAATFYYGRNLRNAIKRRKPDNEPGKEYAYSSGDTQLLGLVLERALKGKTITAYLEEKLWKPLGMEYDATWSLDKEKDGLEKTFCCINARARDFAKIGRLYLNKGNWNGRQVVSQQWVEESTRPGAGGEGFYKYQWWLEGNGTYMAKGILGQYIYVDPSKHLLIVRLGEGHGAVDWENLFNSLAEKY